MRSLSRLIIMMLAWSLVLSPGPAFTEREALPERSKEIGVPEDLERFLNELNALTKQNFLNGMSIEDARQEAFTQWAKNHHADPLGSGAQHGFVHNKELPSNLGVVDMDWLATMGNLGLQGPLGAVAYLRGKELWFLKRSKDQPPDRSTFFNTYPDTNWRALAIADLLASGEVAPEEIFRPGRESQQVQKKRAWLDSMFKIGGNVGFRGAQDHFRSRNEWTGFGSPERLPARQPVESRDRLTTERDLRGGIDANIHIQPEDFQ